MREVISDTSPLQYLYQLDLLHILPALAGRVVVPSSVEKELQAGAELRIDLPNVRSLDWLEIRSPASRRALPLINDLGPGETETLMLALESPAPSLFSTTPLPVVSRKSWEVHFTGTLGLLLDAKKAGLISAVRPLIDQLQTLRFRLSPQARSTILELAGEAEPHA